MQFVKITDRGDEEVVEIPTEDDGTIQLDMVKSQFAGVIGLRYREANRAIAVKIMNGKLYAPENGWSDIVYYCVFPKSKSSSTFIV